MTLRADAGRSAGSMASNPSMTSFSPSGSSGFRSPATSWSFALLKAVPLPLVNDIGLASSTSCRSKQPPSGNGSGAGSSVAPSRYSTTPATDNPSIATEITMKAKW